MKQQGGGVAYWMGGGGHVNVTLSTKPERVNFSTKPERYHRRGQSVVC